jgi:hypothetical protein
MQAVQPSWRAVGEKKTSGMPPASHGWDRTLNLSLQLRKHQTIRNAKQKGGGLEQWKKTPPV